MLKCLHSITQIKRIIQMSETLPSPEEPPIYRGAAELHPGVQEEMAKRRAEIARLAAMIDEEVATTGSPDIAVPTVDPRPTVAEQVAALDAADAKQVPDVSNMPDEDIWKALGVPDGEA